MLRVKKAGYCILTTAKDVIYFKYSKEVYKVFNKC